MMRVTVAQRIQEISLIKVDILAAVSVILVRRVINILGRVNMTSHHYIRNITINISHSRKNMALKTIQTIWAKLNQIWSSLGSQYLTLKLVSQLPKLKQGDVDWTQVDQKSFQFRSTNSLPKLHLRTAVLQMEVQSSSTHQVASLFRSQIFLLLRK